MAKTNNNALVHNFSGRMGDIVFRRLKSGKTIVCRAPVSKTNWAPTPGQAKNRERFKKANAYGLKAMADPELRSFYSNLIKRKPHLTVQTIAVRDFRKSPKVTEIKIMEWRDQVIIRVFAKDDTRVVGLTVTIIDEYGQEVISGEATPEDYQSYWEFCGGRLPGLRGAYMVEAIARDMAGNTGTLTTTLENC
ncbi:hypothetical protein [Flavihumibacter solisilvae]|uniref:Uncharacterized protein n=1 Tax=Flavihumibacter solisilvae TaxID=1349421 RepID=A0A0C1IG39_9BACT|nr:hypothetical protein [Flavihumibacter solisilvae]KIC93125.1 hypothetical protein OI18_19075 [Flavihumibacter solisilvae]